MVALGYMEAARAAAVAAMAPAVPLVTLALALSIQMCCGQHFYVGSIETKKLPSAQKKDTESVTIPKSFENIVKIQKTRFNDNVKPDLSLDLNKTDTKSGDDNSAKYSRNNILGIPGPSLTMINRNAQSLFSRPIGLPTIAKSASNADELRTVAVQAISEQSANDTGPASRSLVLASVAAPAPVVVSPSSRYFTSSQPTLPSVQFLPDFVVSAQALSQNQAPQQILSSFLMPPSNTQSKVQYLHALPLDVSQKTKDNNLLTNSQYLSPTVLSRLLSQSPKVQSDPSAPLQNRCGSRNTKPYDKTFLMLLLKFLNEKNNKDRASQRPCADGGLKRKDALEVMSQEINSASVSMENIDGTGGSRRSGAGARASDSYEEYYSDESSDCSDYSGENYSDHCD